VAERGPWGSLMWWALECYLKGQIGKALVLYLRAAELGYEAAQSNAAWILEKYHSEGICLGKAGLCTDVERHQRAHTLWRYAAEQGNEHAALLIGDAYFYGRVSCTPLEQPCYVSIMDRFVQWLFYPNVWLQRIFFDSVAVFNFQIVYRELRKILIEQQKHT
jgi:TPR repeat protein